jgi:long-chain acyl-CoA synthetase
LWTVESGHLTPTMKLKRKIVMEKYKDLYTKIYIQS